MSYNIESYLNSGIKGSKFTAQVHVGLLGVLGKVLDENSGFNYVEVFDRHRKFIETLISPDNENVHLRVLVNGSDGLEEVIIENIGRYNRDTNSVDFCKSSIEVDTDYNGAYFGQQSENWGVKEFKIYIKRIFERKDRSIVEIKYNIYIDSERFHVLNLTTSGLSVSKKYIDTY